MKLNSVCIFGDSLSKGVILDKTREKYCFVKDNFVNLFCAGRKLIYRNFSKFGCTITKAERLIPLHADVIADSDYTVLEFGGNDCDFNWAEISADPAAHHEPHTPLNLFQTTYARMIAKVRELGGTPLLLNLPPIDPKRYFAWISRGLNAENILKWLGGSDSYIYRWHEMYNICIHSIASAMRVPIIDIRSAFLLRTNYSELLCDDGIHPNEAGHRLISSTLSRTVAALA